MKSKFDKRLEQIFKKHKLLCNNEEHKLKLDCDLDSDIKQLIRDEVIGEMEVKEKEKPKRGRPRKKPSVTFTKIAIGEPIIIRNQLRKEELEKLGL